MRSLAFAWRSLVRQPARAGLGIAGVAAVGALLFDMLLLSRGLVVSLRQMLDGVGFDVRVTATEQLPGGPPLTDVTPLSAAIADLPEVDTVVTRMLASAYVDRPDKTVLWVSLLGIRTVCAAATDDACPAGSNRRAWILEEGRDLPAVGGDQRPPILVNRNLARSLDLTLGAELRLRGDCGLNRLTPQAVTFRVAGIASFPFEDESQRTAASLLDHARRLCGEDGRDEADLLLVASRDTAGSDAAVQAIRRLRPDVHAFTNEEVVARFQQVGFAYFRQISTVLATITLFFGFLLITVLLTVSVNQRLGEIAALRALGLTRTRVVADVLWESVMMVGAGGLAALPLGLALSNWLDAILRGMPGIPADLHFFVFQQRALGLYGALLATTALLAALYPSRLVAGLPIAATLRDEVTS